MVARCFSNSRSYAMCTLLRLATRSASCERAGSCCLVVASAKLVIQTQEAPDGGAQGAPMNDLVDHAMLQAELGGTRIFRQVLVHELFEHSRSGEADDGLWLRKDHVAEHGKAGGYPTS